MDRDVFLTARKTFCAIGAQLQRFIHVTGERKMKNVMFVLMVVVAFTVFADAEMVVSDFDDGTTQGWQLTEPAYSDLLIVPDSSGGKALLGYDTTAGHGGPVLVSPASYTGDLSGYTALEWDEYIYYFGQDNAYRDTIFPVIRGPQDTWFFPVDTPSGGPFEVWTHRSIPLEASYWRKKSIDPGPLSFEEVISNVQSIELSMVCNWLTQEEAIIDNITLVPEPATLVILGMGGLAIRRRN